MPVIVVFVLSWSAFSAGGQRQQQLPGTTGRAQSPTGVPVIWHDPGAVEQIDFAGGVGGRDGAPTRPLIFDEENLTGSNPKIRVTDANGVKWSVKFGPEVRAETFSTRIAWAAGYFVEPEYFVGQGQISGVGSLTRARRYIEADGTFRDARFERRTDKGVVKFEGKDSWSWVENPFLGTKELNGLKVIVMLVSDWDNKDVRDIKRGSNTAVYQEPEGEARYLITDWGATMGKWGSYLTREKWDCKGYQQQTPNFLRGVTGATLTWGYSGQHTQDFRGDISRDDVRWLLRYLGRITDDQLRLGLEASGATREENDCFTTAIRARIDRMKACADVDGESPGGCKKR
jgi:hypothetical protein